MPTRPGNQRNAVALCDREESGVLLKPTAAARPGRTVLQKELEVILTRQLADCLAMPIFIVNPQGTLIFYNEPAETLLGVRFEESGELVASQWATAFVPTDFRGRPLPPEELPLMSALRERRPAHKDFWIRGLDRAQRHIFVTAFPLIGRAGRFLGGVAIFWENSRR